MMRRPPGGRCRSLWTADCWTRCSGRAELLYPANGIESLNYPVTKACDHVPGDDDAVKLALELSTNKEIQKYLHT
jgi:hypothetical protein